MGIFQDDDEEYEPWRWTLGDPVDDSNGGTMDPQNWGHGYSEVEEDESDHYIGSYEYFKRQAKTCSIKGDHVSAIGFYREILRQAGESALKYETLVAIADEYEAMGDYGSAEECWNRCCQAKYKFYMYSAGKGDFLYRRGRYGEAIAAYEESLRALELMEDREISLSHLKYYARIIHFIISSYNNLGKNNRKEKYHNELKQGIDRYLHSKWAEGRKTDAYHISKIAWEIYEDDRMIDEARILIDSAIELYPTANDYKRKAIILEDDFQYDEALRYHKKAERAFKRSNKEFIAEKMEIADKYYNQGLYGDANKFYKMVLRRDYNNVKARNRASECERILRLSTEAQNDLRQQALEKLKRQEERKKREQERIAHEKRMKEIEERERKRKEECEKNPECIKKEIQHFKRKLFKDYYLLLHFEHYQNKSDIKFKEILEYEDLLEKMGIGENYSREDLKTLKKENKRIKYIISHVGGEYRGNGVKLFVKNQKKIDELERRYPEKGFFKSVIKEVFNNSEDIVSFEIESSARDKMRIAKDKSSSNNNVALQKAMDLLNQAKADSSEYLKNKNPNQHPNLINLNNDISGLEREIYNKIDKLINLHKKRLFLIERDKYLNNQFDGKPGMDLKLINEDNEDTVTVFHEDNPVGIISKTFGSDFEKQFSDMSQLQYLPENSDAKYYFKYGKFDIIEIEEHTLIEAKAKFKSKQRNLINKYPKEELITLGPGIDKYIELKQGMKFKLIKESDSDSIKVYWGNDKLGFVANNRVCGLTSKASDIKIPDDCYAEYLCKYEYNYHVARIIDKLTPAKDYMSKGEYYKAIGALDELLDEELDNIEYWSIKCSCHMNLKQYGEADGCYDKLIELNPNNSEYRENKASNLCNMKRFDDAIDCLDDAILINPNNSDFISLKETVLELKEKEELRVKQEKILKEYPKHELITITEIDNNHPDFEEKMTFKLIKESYDGFIAVYLDDDKIGYVANSEDTVCDLTSDAWEIEAGPDIFYATYVMNYCGEYHIARIVNS